VFIRVFGLASKKYQKTISPRYNITGVKSIEGDVNTYAASLGHTNLKTTQSYFGSFDDEKTKGYLDALL